VLVGASMGGTLVVAAASRTSARLAAVIALSSPAYYADTDALPAVPRIAAPLLLVCGTLDKVSSATSATSTPRPPRPNTNRLVLVNTNAHGTQLVEAGPNSRPQPQAYAALRGIPGDVRPAERMKRLRDFPDRRRSRQHTSWR
jgi:pimeloyl-ACP methyl ester carboxylesterase